MPDYPIETQRKLIVAVDVANTSLASELITSLGLKHVIYKIGLELLFNGGADLVQTLSNDGYSIFVDAKLLDIGNTVKRATAQIASLGANYLTIHAQDSKTLMSAYEGAQGTALKLLGVTVLTNLDQSSLDEQGTSFSLNDLVARRANLAHHAQYYGVVASPNEVADLKRQHPDLALITPGIRLAALKIENDDQTRYATVTQAIQNGSDHIVVGRPITTAANPAQAASMILNEITEALDY